MIFILLILTGVWSSDSSGVGELRKNRLEDNQKGGFGEVLELLPVVSLFNSAVSFPEGEAFFHEQVSFFCRIQFPGHG